MRYIFADDTPIRLKAGKDADPQVIGDALEKITIDNGGELKPSAVVDAARSKRHPLHKHFVWDDVAAAQQYRIDQARHIIRIVRVVDKNTEEGNTRAFQSINLGNGTSYRAIDDIRRSASFQLALLERAEKELNTFRQRYRHFTEVCRHVKRAQDRIAEELHQDA